MSSFHISGLVMTLLIVSACNSGPDRMGHVYFRQEALASAVNTVTIEGAAEAVFDLVTTARFWSQWHPATTAVTGVTERPYRLGDRINERGRIGMGEFNVIWRVTEHVRPRMVVLQAEGSPARITYSFNVRGSGTEFTRKLEYKTEDLGTVAADPSEVNKLMQAQSEQAVKQLKALVEKIIRAEAIETRSK
jgi:Polyketide cyclase / dehydrase and lipid transport